ncbi:hypothetical protein VTO73DRAFT_13654 [Trametes versicolor]
MAAPCLSLWKLLLCSVLISPGSLTSASFIPASAVGDHMLIDTILEPKNGTVWTPKSTAKIAWKTNASDPHTLQPVDFSKPLTIGLWKDSEDKPNGRLLPVVFDEVAYRSNGSVTVNVPFLEEGAGYGVVVYTNDSHNLYWSEIFAVGPSN